MTKQSMCPSAHNNKEAGALSQLLMNSGNTPRQFQQKAGSVLRLTKKFLRNQSGNLAVVMGVMSVPMMGMLGGSLDYAEYLRMKHRLQHALDQATLAAARKVEEGEEMPEAKVSAASSFGANLGNTNARFVGALDDVKQQENGSIKGTASGRISTTLLSLIGVYELEFDAQSTVIPRNTGFEIALVLDNSGSMDDDMVTLRKAAKDLVKVTFKNESTSDRFSYSVVPFSAMVNVGSQYSSASWMDTNAQSSTHKENFSFEEYSHSGTHEDAKTYKSSSQLATDDPAKYSTLFPTKNRFSLYNMLGTDWAGCVEQRPGALAVNDTAPDSSNGDTLFVPTFAPDEPDDGKNLSAQNMNRDDKNDYSYTNSSNTAYGQDDEDYANDYLNDRPSSCPQPVAAVAAVPEVKSKKYCKKSKHYERNADGSLKTNGSGDPICKKSKHDRWRDHEVVLQEATEGVEGHDEWLSTEKAQAQTCKYQNADTHGSFWAGRGPNYYCTAKPLLPLTNQRSDIDAKLTSMEASGMTNITAGFMWGWRTLSTAEPFTNGKPESDTTNTKVIVLMSDGANTYNGESNHNHSTYGSWGFGAKGHLDGSTDSGSDFSTAMNSKLATACANAKAEKIMVVTIAFRLAEGSTTANLLENCASVVDGKRQFKSAQNASQLSQEFKTIAEELSQLRLAQ